MVGKLKYITIIQIAFLFVLTNSGCGFWTNFKTYFNTYYNANRIYEETEKEILEERENLFELEEQKISNNQNKALTDVVKKTSSILQHNKESDYVAEALILTGKSFYYQQNYSRGLRKFQELASMPENELSLENKLWIAKSNLQLRSFTKAVKLFNEVIVEADSNEITEIEVEAYRSLISYYIYNEQNNEALRIIQKLVQLDIEDELRAEVVYEMGLLYLQAENNEAAENAFYEALDLSPSFEIEFNSRFELAKIKKNQGDIEGSLEQLDDLKNQDKFEDSWDKIDLEIAKIYYDGNKIENALEKFTEVDTTYQSTESSGIASFYRAEILENYQHDYDSAMGFYRTAMMSKAPQDIRDIAKKRNLLLDKYISYHNKIEEMNKQLIYLTDENIFLQDSLEYVELMREDSIKRAENQNNKIPTGRGGRKQKNNTLKIKEPQRPVLSADSLNSLNSKYYFGLANLLFTEFDDPDSAYFYYNKSLESKEDNPDQAQALYAIGNYFLIKEEKQKADSVFHKVYDEFQFDPIRNEAAKHIGKPLYDFDKDPVEDDYTEAELLYENKEYIEAIEKLEKIYSEHPKSIYASKSLYTIGYIYENELNLPDSAASAYEELSKKYRNTEYAKSILIKLTGHKQEQRRLQAIQDSIKKANESIAVDSNLTDSTIVKDQPEKVLEESMKPEINEEMPKTTPNETKAVKPKRVNPRRPNG